VPPVAFSVVLYAWFGTPPGSAVVLIARAAPACTTKRVTVALAVCAGEPASLTDTPNEKFPFPVGFPEMIPVEATRLRPAGRLPELIDHVYDPVPPVACSAVE
jgi:hypothetical protein